MRAGRETKTRLIPGFAALGAGRPLLALSEVEGCLPRGDHPSTVLGVRRLIPDVGRKLCAAAAGHQARGFTILEMMIVVTIILILLSLGAGMYQQSVVRAKEAALKQDLQVLRNAIDQYTLDKAQAPQSLDELVAAGYLREVPVDPLTRRKDWRVDIGDVAISPEQATGSGIVDVHSNSDLVSPFEGSPYSAW